MTLFRARQVPKRHAMSRRRHAEGPLPDARRQEHRAAHGGGPRAVAQSWLEARILLGRGKSRTRRGPGYHARAKGAYSPRSLNGRRSLKGAAGDSSTTFQTSASATGSATRATTNWLGRACFGLQVTNKRVVLRSCI